jgi:hypothetical protein
MQYQSDDVLPNSASDPRSDGRLPGEELQFTLILYL